MKSVRLSNPVESNFDRNETFSLENIPEHFDSVTEEALRETQRTALDKAGQVTEFTPGALDNALMSADGQFEGAYSTLEGDYGKRLTNLRNAYNDGLTDVRRAFQLYKSQVAEYNIALKNYSDANKVIRGSALPDNLAITDEDTKSIDRAIKGLE